MSDEFPILDDGPGVPERPSYQLPPDELDRMVRLANHLAKREAEMPLRRRIASWLEATARHR